jgi:predicted dithiol-disulfide oxidoreductase (DUF899 family)
MSDRSRAAQRRASRRNREEHDVELPPIVSPQQWKAAREQMPIKEKRLTRARDALAAKRRRMQAAPMSNRTHRKAS